MANSTLVSLKDAILGRDAQTRYEARYRLIRSLALRNGFRLYNKNLNWYKDAEYQKTWAGFAESKGEKNIHERRFNLFNFARALRSVPGDLVECGLFKGAGSYLMLAASAGTGKHLHGFDSFEGLSAPKAEDRTKTSEAFVWQENDLAVGEEIVERNLAEFAGQFTLYKGWIPERFSSVADRKFSLVHIDVDLYEPTLAAAEFFFSRLQPGGLIVCDDYGFDTCPGATKAMDQVAAHHGLSTVHLTTGQGLLFKH